RSAGTDFLAVLYDQARWYGHWAQHLPLDCRVSRRRPVLLEHREWGCSILVHVAAGLTLSLMTSGTVFLVDDNEAFRQSTRWLLESHGLHVSAFKSGQDFLEAYAPSSTGR